MRLSQKSLKCLREMINEKTMYRSGPVLVALFNKLGSNDSYGQGFPSRWVYTDQKLNTLNGTPGLDKCINMVFAPVNFIGNMETLSLCLDEFNPNRSLESHGYRMSVKHANLCHCVIAPRLF